MAKPRNARSSRADIPSDTPVSSPADTLHDAIAGAAGEVTPVDTDAALRSLERADGMLPPADEPPAPAPGAAPASNGNGATRDRSSRSARSSRANRSGIPNAREAGVYGGRKTRATMERELQEAAAELATLRAQQERQSAQTNEEIVGQLTTTLREGFRMVGSGLAMWRGPHWKFTNDECDMLAAGWTPMAVEHAETIQQNAPWLFGAAVTLQVLVPRLERDAELRKMHGAQLTPVVVETAP